MNITPENIPTDYVETEDFTDQIDFISDAAEDVRQFNGLLSDILKPLTAQFEGCPSPMSKTEMATLELQGLRIITLLRAIREKADAIGEAAKAIEEVGGLK